jgi:peptide/nickel transport system substrate-binding protein
MEERSMASPDSSVSPEPAPAPTPPPAPRRRPWKLIAVIVAVIVVLSLVAAYVILSNRGPTTSVVVYATNSDLVSLDPSSEFSNSIILLPNVYETLTRWNPTTNQAEALLATSWSPSQDGLTWAFTLRQGVTFHDGTPFNATAVKFSIERTVYMNQGAAYIWGPLTGAYAYWAVAGTPQPWETPEWANFTSEAITIVDAYHVTLHLDYAAAMDEVASSGYGAYMLSPNTPPTTATAGNLTQQFATQQNWFNVQHHDSGSGPYVINVTSYKQSNAVLDRFQGYWGGWRAGQFEHAVIETFSAPAQREQAIVSGSVDIGIDPPLADLPALRGNSAVSVVTNPSYRALYAFFNMQKAPTDNLSVRRALAYAIPYDQIVSSVVNNTGTQSIGVVPDTMWGHDSTLPRYTYNLTRAEELLTEAGYPQGGFTLNYTYLLDDPYEGDIGVLWKENLATLGVTLNLEPKTWDVQWAEAKADPTVAQSIFVMYWWPTYVTPFDFLYNMFSTDSYQFFNLGYYQNPKFDSAIFNGSADEATNPTQALQNYSASQVMLYHDLPGLGLVDMKNVYLLRSNLHGFSDNPAYPLVVFFYQLSR